MIHFQVEECMESGAALAALGAGLDAARVRRALARRLRSTGKFPLSINKKSLFEILNDSIYRSQPLKKQQGT